MSHSERRNRDWTRLVREFEKMKWDDSKYRGMTDKIIKAFYAAHDKLGPGFYEEAYHRALVIELRKEFRSVESERSFAVIVEFKRFDNFYEIERRRLRLE